MARVFTREQFYELVWSKPMTHLAKDFAISDVALHKICRKHGIPNPPLGWWAKKAAGKKVKQTPLPEAKPGAPDRITISDGELGRESAKLAAAREQARIQASDGDDNEAAPPHPIVDRTIAALRKAKPSDIGLVAVSQGGLIKCEVAPRSVDRLAVILLRIVRAASLQGFQLVGGEGAAHFKSETEVIGFSISELVKREKHVLTDAERSKEEAWQRKRDLAARRNAWDAVLLDRPRFPEWDYHPTGQLSFEFEQVYVFGGGTGPRRSFRDAKIQRLETMASEIGVGLAVLAAAKTEQRLKREAEERRREEERRRRELAERAKHIEDRRIAGLGAILAELDELDRLRRLIAMLTTEVAAEPTARLTTFLSWAQDHLAKREARLSAQAIEERFAAAHLFGDDDEHAFTPSRWY
ncbi:hypothetical protein SAMN02745126_01781 [Enhydrobacter aerosaccus]|uniref:Uncharacterized protein n=1 Tax=Enhydrobacter aerosaccus TaxID=225324 RepID=A0A1T4LYG6_9HYPH|nr:hypothetical protein [Enhydrobacter aerosaccus]SJZ59676.1 hypothetical protein SAMN02745126_01781 [Enhydrobacter aerosaccus]